MLLTFKGRGTKQGEVPVGMAEALKYFEDIVSFIQKIEDVKTVKPLGRPGAYLMIDHPIGALNYYVTIASAIQHEVTPSGLIITPLDFDHEGIKSEHQVLKAYCSSELVATPVDENRTKIAFNMDFAVEFPVPMALRLMPQGIITAAADGVMTLKMGTTVESMYKKVLEDFRLAPN